MKAAFSIMALCFAAACGGAGGSTSTISTSSAPIAIEDLPQIAVSDAPSETFTSLINDVRSDAGVQPLSYDTRLGAAARRHANDMHANDFFEHQGSDGSTVGTRVSDEGYSYWSVGENIAWGHSNEAAVLQGWQESTTGHRENNENSQFEHFGLAKAGDSSNRYWVLVLADPRIENP